MQSQLDMAQISLVGLSEQRMGQEQWSSYPVTLLCRIRGDWSEKLGDWLKTLPGPTNEFKDSRDPRYGEMTDAACELAV
jgi:hypothetical protein